MKRPKHIVSPLTAEEILRDIKVTKRDMQIVRKTIKKIKK